MQICDKYIYILGFKTISKSVQTVSSLKMYASSDVKYRDYPKPCEIWLMFLLLKNLDYVFTANLIGSKPFLHFFYASLVTRL